ncbi:MAG: ABC transporter ATP-binding protein/permease [Caldilineaceae bacterium]|nr:ABC transporter ATP-binding protein/permease [Caldilineaceae bacterium]
MSTFKSRLSNFIDVRNERNPSWIPAGIRRGIRRVSGGDSWTAQMLRGLLWQYRWLVGLALAANIAAAVFEGSTMAIFTLALQALSGDLSNGLTISLGIFDPMIEGIVSGYSASNLFMIFIGMAVVSQLLRSGLQFGGQVATSYLVAWLEGDLRRRLFRQFVSVSYPQISRYKVGDLISYVEQIVRVGNMLTGVNKLLSDGLLVLAYVCVLLWLSWPMTLAAVGALLLLMTALRGINSKLRTLSERFMNASIAFNENILEYLQGIRLVHTFGRKEYVLDTIEPIVVDSVQARRQGSVRYSTITPIYQSLTVVGVAAFLLIGYIWMGGNLSAIPRLLTFVFVLYRLLPFVTVMNNNFASIYDSMPFANRVAEILRTDDKEFPRSGNHPIDQLRQGIDFRAVVLRYPETDKDAIHELTLTIPQGKMTAFVGASGAGKSSIVNLLTRLYDPTGGEILADGVPIGEYALADWQTLFGVVDQDTFVFNASVADNIRFGRLEASQAEVEAAARIANAHDFIQELHNGYATVVGDRGFRLSGGQRQRIAIARAVVRQPNVLIFDEATSALDSQSERLIQDALEGLRQERTLIVIAHRLSTIAKADQILVLDEGILTESGSHSELLDRNGRYASLWKLQSSSIDGGDD